MSARSNLSGSLILCLAFTLIGCSTPQGLDSVQVSPTSQSLTVGQTVQFTATGTFGNANRPSTQNITSSVTWTSSIPSVATINASGVATAVSSGTTTITAGATAYNGPVSSSAILTVAGSSGGVAGGTGGSTGTGGTGGSGSNILSLTIIPSGIVFGALTQSGQFLAIGTFSTAPTVRDVTNQVTWLTSQPNKFPVTNNIGSGAPGAGTQNGGVVSAYEASVGNVGATITAEMLDTNGSLAVATAAVGCPYVAATPPTPATATTPATPGNPGTCNQTNIPPLLSTLTVYNEGLNTSNWLLTAPSATATPTVIHCGPGWAANGGTGGSVCTATYPLNTTVTITAPAQNGVRFGGWSSNCMNTGTITQTGPNTCTIFLSTSDATVGAIFN
jgi:hypothetical protein